MGEEKVTKAKDFIHTQPSQREWDAHAWGWKVPEVKCPKDGAPIVYNGNYFCSNYTFIPKGKKPTPGKCDWTLSHPAATVADLDICEALGIEPTG